MPIQDTPERNSKENPKFIFLVEISLSAGDPSTVISHSAGLNTELDKEHPQVSCQILGSRQGTARMGTIFL